MMMTDIPSFIIQPTQLYNLSNYINNYLNDNVICHYSMVHQDANYENVIKNHLKSIRGNCLRSMKRGNLQLTDVINHIDNFVEKINRINTIFNLSICPKEHITNIIVHDNICKVLYRNNLAKNKNVKYEYSYFTDKYDTDRFTIYTSDFILSEFIENDFTILEMIEFYEKKLEEFKFINSPIFINNIKQIILDKIKNDENKFDIIRECPTILKQVFNNDENFILLLLSYRTTDVNDFIKYIETLELYFEMESLEIKNYIKHQTIINDDIVFNHINDNIKNKINNTYAYNLAKDKDTMMVKLISSLIERIFNHQQFDKSFEKTEYNNMKKYIPNDILYRYNKVLNGTQIIKNYDNIYSYKIHPQVLDFDFDVGYQEKKLDDNTTKQCYLHLGSCEIEFNNSKIKCLPIHMKIINLINEDKYLMNGKIFPHYKPTYIKQIEDELYEASIISLSDEGYIINVDYSGDIDLTDKDMIKKKNQLEERLYTQVMFDRVDITTANTVNLLKIGPLNFNSLFYKLVDKITTFRLTKDSLKEYLETMISKDYVKDEDNMYHYVI